MWHPQCLTRRLARKGQFWGTGGGLVHGSDGIPSYQAGKKERSAALRGFSPKKRPDVGLDWSWLVALFLDAKNMLKLIAKSGLMNPGVILQALKYLKEVEYFERRLATGLSHASVGWFFVVARLHGSQWETSAYRCCLVELKEMGSWCSIWFNDAQIHIDVNQHLEFDWKLMKTVDTSR